MCGIVTWALLITGNISLSKQIQEHIEDKSAHLRKFSSSIANNYDSPFVVKQKVWNSLVSSAILYGSESWWTKSLNAIEAFPGIPQGNVGGKTVNVHIPRKS